MGETLPGDNQQLGQNWSKEHVDVPPASTTISEPIPSAAFNATLQQDNNASQATVPQHTSLVAEWDPWSKVVRDQCREQECKAGVNPQGSSQGNIALRINKQSPGLT